MNLGHLAIFHAVAEEGNISRGAKRLMVSQPAISKQLRAFERSLGTTLFERIPRGVRLTDAGTLLLDYARRISVLQEEAVAALGELGGLVRGRLAVAASTTIGIYLLPELFVEFRQKYPGIDATLEVSHSRDIVQRLAQGEFDIALVESLPTAVNCDFEPFLVDELVAIAKIGHRLTKLKRVSASAFCQEPFIVRSTNSDTKSLVEQELVKYGLTVQPVMAVPSNEAVKRAVAAGLGVAIVSRLSVSNELKMKTLSVLRVSGLAIRRPLYRVCRRGVRQRGAVDAFIRLISARLAH